MLFADTLTLDRRQRTRDGYMAVRAKVARTGVYDYAGYEIDPNDEHGLRDAGIVKVLRDNDTVFDKRAVQSFIGKPVTDNHPREPVSSDNWKDLAGGMIMGAMKDGEYLAFDILLTDADLISKVEAGKRELSNGYAAELEFGDFQAADGTRCQARQRSLFGNHIAVVDKGRAGPECRIADAATCDPITAEILTEFLRDGETYSGSGDDDKNKGAGGGEPQPRLNQGDTQMATKTIIIDSVPFEVSDQAAAAIAKVQGQLADATARADKAEKDVATLTADKANVEAERDKAVKDLADAKPTTAQLLDAAKAYQATADKAKAMGVTVTDDMSEVEIQRAAVNAKLGDAAKDWSDENVAVAFATLAVDAKSAPIDPLRKVLADSKPTSFTTENIRDMALNGQLRDVAAK